MDEFKKNRNIYYLLPGMGRGAHAKKIRNRWIAIFVWLIVSGIIYLALNYWTE